MYNQDNIVYAIPIDPEIPFNFEDSISCTKAISYSRTIKWCAIFDFILCIINVLCNINNIESLLVWLFLSLLSIFGYYGAKFYKNYLLISFNLYNIIVIVAHIINSNNGNDDNNVLNTFIILINIFSIIVTTYIVYITTRFIILVYYISDLDKRRLHTVRAYPKLFIWY